jgi:POT family proton-dependent oligopeptide transporter
MMYLQMFFSANLFIERLVDKDVFGFHLATTVFYASESIFIILLGPIFAWLWHELSAHDKSPSFITKFILGIFFAGLGFLVLSISTKFPNATGLVNPAWVFLAYLLITIGELLLSPIGLSAVTLLAPSNLVGLMMGVWFVAIGFGGVFAGTIAKLSSVPDNVIDTAAKLAIYQEAFLDYACIAFFVAIMLFFARFMVKKFVLR